ncbi:hypothetical protein ABFS82_04G086200 [Erythranthe guttata]|uniref:ascorbate ferrireductase (transmembrane) n=1 Tax=Erythranthe guttata TaxID=4155 RepID=A0A022S270_ERYGU|nr:PREDICTED: probable ascorbate-specific transmembrane electron transporter 1 [Erythranthe guttata]EYU45963.1 hypothetical protein MIMGU_mgv1a013302mg [Erythranthe guttata]|eukprot:XP_012836567.1 PREDICTED: probable ascorbate-specific transmembrane electron transporter 1 [Erythranthe guttata]
MATKGSSSYQASAFPATVLAHVSAAAIVTLVLVWLLHFREGLAFKSDNKAKIFNLHPLLMVLGFVLISGEGIIAYKTIPAIRETQKLFHLLLHLTALVSGIIGIYAVFRFHYLKGIPDMYSLHSWLGMSTICLFAIQWVFSLFTFWYPRAQASTRARLAPWHTVLGTVIFVMAILSAETGLVEKFFFLGLRRSQEALIINFVGLLIFLFGVFVGLSVVLPRSSY